MNLTTGYYWIKFPGNDYWEPSGYDENFKIFMLIGSVDPWYPFQLTIGEKIEPPK
jgi:hypothetical protein